MLKKLLSHYRRPNIGPTTHEGTLNEELREKKKSKNKVTLFKFYEIGKRKRSSSQNSKGVSNA